MAASLPDLRALLTVAVLAPLVALAASPRSGPRGPAADRTLVIDARSWEVNTNTNHVVMSDVTISQAGLKIQAHQAEGTGPELSFENSRWQFRGNVRLTFEGGNLEADQATVSIDDNRIARAEASGRPAVFEQKLPNVDRSAQGRAANIDFDVGQGRVTLTQDIWFTDGRNEWRSDVAPLVYSVRDRRLQSGGAAPDAAPAPASEPGSETAPKSGERIHIIIRPKDEEGGTAEPPTP